MHDHEILLGIDIGATRVKLGIVRNDKVLGKRVVTLADEHRDEKSLVSYLARTVRSLLGAHDVAEASVKAVGIGAPGIIDFARGVVVRSPNFPGWKNFALASALQDALGLRVSLDNDANCVTLGEWRLGAGGGVPHMVCLTLGSGLGGGLVLGGELYRGSLGMAGEVGHIVVEPEGYPCGCGGRGCLEQYASRNGLVNFVKEDEYFGAHTEQMVNDPDLPKEVWRRAKSGDRKARQYYEEMGYRLAIGIGALLTTLNLQLVVLSGGMAGAAELFMPTLLRELPSRAYGPLAGRCRVVVGTLGEDAGILGAAALALSRP